ncbi:hypothetical protein Pla22_28300 [Rubripirellula amarantea]|uniref:Uncharacterized protein n=1 Tax=Rubripirellula amarantea TaxID=2527999 RepID=A0A5C5WZ36_9BACT|nr:hypothetical protein Pla22_28300 [Rubripirellula amarantea]
MLSSDFSDIPNPFAFTATESQILGRRQPARSALRNAVKYLVLVAMCFAALLAVRHLSGHYLLSRLTDDFQTQPPHVQQARLVQIQAFGKTGIPHLVDALAAKDYETARVAFELLKSSQTRWPTLGQSSALQRHAIMVKAIDRVAVHMPDDRTGWGTALIQQSVMESVDQADDEKRSLYASANDVLKKLALSNRSGPSILNEGPINDGQPRRLIVRATPLPVEQFEETGTWSTWPPEPEAMLKATMDQQIASNERSAAEAIAAEQATSEPSIYRSGSSSSSLRAVPAEESIVLKSIDDAYDSNDVQSVTHLVDTPMESASTHSVMTWLLSEHEQLRSQAHLELLARGLSESQIEMAKSAVNPDVSVRLDFVHRVIRHPDVDPRPWLKLMTEDESREVLAEVISVLGTMPDQESAGFLRTLMVRHSSDPKIVARIRSVLERR